MSVARCGGAHDNLTVPVHQCACPQCRTRKPHPDRALHRRINLLASRLDEQQRRWFAGLEAMRIGRGGQHLIAQVTGLNRHTIARGCRELQADLQSRPVGRVRRVGGGRPAAEARDPALPDVLEALLESETVGDPMAVRAKAKRSSLAHLSAKLAAAGHPASRPTASRLLRKLE